MHISFAAVFSRLLSTDKLCIQWVLFAKRPLKPDQLYFAILSGMRPEVLKAWDRSETTTDIIKKYILSSSKGLTEITRSTTPTVQLIHESVKDFLLKENGLREVWSELGNNFQAESHELLKQCCLNYMSIDLTSLNMRSLLREASSTKACQSADRAFPFLEYAVRNVLYHADAAQKGGVSQMGFIKSFQLADWIKLDNLFEKHHVRRHTPKASLLYIFTENNLASLIKNHSNHSTCFQVEGERYGPPIFAAMATGSREAVRNLLKAEVEPSP